METAQIRYSWENLLVLWLVWIRINAHIFDSDYTYTL
jgi:hypothetical protein